MAERTDALAGTRVTSLEAWLALPRGRGSSTGPVKQLLSQPEVPANGGPQVGAEGPQVWAACWGASAGADRPQAVLLKSRPYSQEK